MTQEQPDEVAVTIIVPTFRSGPGLQRVFDSIDAVTLPPGRLEVIFVDDGSGDDTVERLHAFADGRPYVRVIELENSGWPSRPRNVAIEQARGEYLLFMDHDDSLFPGALRRAYDFAVEQDADVVSPKESKTNDAWWSLQDADFSNTADIRLAGGVRRMIPMVPHKLYRRRFLLDHGIRFPEGSRFLWEDWYVNVPSYRHGKVAALVDTVMYLWHGSDTNTTHTFDPDREDYWDRLDDLFEHIGTTLSGAEFEEDRTMLIRHNLDTRVILQASRRLTERVYEDPSVTSELTDQESMMLPRAVRLLERYCDKNIMRELPQAERAQVRLLRRQRAALIRSLQLVLDSFEVTVRVTELAWRGGKLHLELETRWKTSEPELVSVVARRRGARLDMGRQLNWVLSRALRTADDPREPVTQLAIRDRSGRVSWPVGTEGVGAAQVTRTGIVYRTHAVIDPATVAAGAPLPESVLDLRARSVWFGLRSYGGVEFKRAPAAMLTGHRQGTAYRNTKGLFSLDLAGTLRVPAIDAGPEVGAAGPVTGFRARLTALAMHDPQPVEVDLAAIPAAAAVMELEGDARQQRAAELADTRGLSARIDIEGDEAWLTGSADLPEGDYEIWAHRGEKWARTRYTMAVSADGMATLATR